MISTFPKRTRLRQNVINILGNQKKCLEINLKKGVRALYANFSPSELDSVVDDVLLELEDSGIAEFSADNYITLTQVGRGEYGSITAKRELKQRKKARIAHLVKQGRVKKEERAAAKDYHERLKLKLGRLAQLLGKNWKQEHELVKGGPVILDLVWYASPSKISHAFEVQHRGEWKNAIGNLEAMRRYNEDCKLFVIVANEKQVRPIQQLLGAKLDTSIRILKASQISDWLAVLEKGPDNLRLQLLDTIKSIMH
jgi:hypothetical protein